MCIGGYTGGEAGEGGDEDVEESVFDTESNSLIFLSTTTTLDLAEGEHGEDWHQQQGGVVEEHLH